MADPRPPQDIRKTEERNGPRTGSGGGAAYKGGYGAGGLGSGAHQRASAGAPMQNADPWDAPGVTPEGRRTGSSTDGPRIAIDEESEPSPPGDDAD
jgi:hypothetical protein